MSEGTQDDATEPTASCSGCGERVGLTDRSGYPIRTQFGLAESLRIGRGSYLIPHDYPRQSQHAGARCPGSGRKVSPA